MAKKPEPSVKDKPLKFEHIYEDDECISIWKYDKTKFANGPISLRLIPWRLIDINSPEFKINDENIGLFDNLKIKESYKLDIGTVKF